MPIYLHYAFWLTIIALLCFTLERLSPWRSQALLRPGIPQDIFWLVFNGHFLSLLLALITVPTAAFVNRSLMADGFPALDSLRLLARQPLWAQFLLVLLVKDFVEYAIHRLMHSIPALWEFHKLHHSIQTMDWIGNFRFHWGEVLVYRTLAYIPLVVLGAHPTVLLAIAVLWTLMLTLNHANIPLSWGRLRYLLNSPMMHIWHHDTEIHKRSGQNFGQVLSIWDWLLGTAYWPSERDQPEQLGFEGLDTYPRGLLHRLTYPILKRRASEKS